MVIKAAYYPNKKCRFFLAECHLAFMIFCLSNAAKQIFVPILLFAPDVTHVRKCFKPAGRTIYFKYHVIIVLKEASLMNTHRFKRLIWFQVCPLKTLEVEKHRHSWLNSFKNGRIFISFQTDAAHSWSETMKCFKGIYRWIYVFKLPLAKTWR